MMYQRNLIMFKLNSETGFLQKTLHKHVITFPLNPSDLHLNLTRNPDESKSKWKHCFTDSAPVLYSHVHF